MKKNKKCQALLCDIIKCFTISTPVRVCGFGNIVVGIQFTKHIQPFHYTVAHADSVNHMLVDETKVPLLVDACQSCPFTMLGTCDYEKAVNVVLSGENKAHYIIMITSLTGKDNASELLPKLHAMAPMTIFDVGSLTVSVSDDIQKKLA